MWKTWNPYFICLKKRLAPPINGLYASESKSMGTVISINRNPRIIIIKIRGINMRRK
jgi:hypothetical protein